MNGKGLKGVRAWSVEGILAWGGLRIINDFTCTWDIAAFQFIMQLWWGIVTVQISNIISTTTDQGWRGMLRGEGGRGGRATRPKKVGLRRILRNAKRVRHINGKLFHALGRGVRGGRLGALALRGVGGKAADGGRNREPAYGGRWAIPTGAPPLLFPIVSDAFLIF